MDRCTSRAEAIADMEELKKLSNQLNTCAHYVDDEFRGKWHRIMNGIISERTSVLESIVDAASEASNSDDYLLFLLK